MPIVTCQALVERSGPVSLYGRGDHVYGSVPIYGAIEGQGANRFTARIHGETEASATIEAEARPQLRRDWSLDLNFSDGFHWSEPPILHVLGRDIPLAKYAEPRIRTQLAHVRSRALAAARRLDLHDKAATAWQHAFEPIKLADDPQIWLQLTPQNAAFAGVRANAKVLSGSLELSGSAETVVGQAPPAVTPTTTLPPLRTRRRRARPPSMSFCRYASITTRCATRSCRWSWRCKRARTSFSRVQVYPSAGKLRHRLARCKSV